MLPVVVLPRERELALVPDDLLAHLEADPLEPGLHLAGAREASQT